ncbi:MAG TPA: NAD-binding protein [Rubrobacteraceae bacterium]|nr:NAD-binding protein [Rubrobacteraceae bacterium]
MGAKTLWLGEAGAGSSLKLVTNNWIVGLLGTLAETVALAEAVGVDPSQFLQAIEGGPLGVPYAQIKGQMMIGKEFPTSFSAKLARKDAGLVLEAAGASGLRLPLTEAVAAHFDEAINAGHGEEDMAAIYQTARSDRG